MLIDLLLISIGLIGLTISTFIDVKTREIPDWLNYSLIFIGLSLRLIYSLLYNEWLYLIFGLIGFGAMFFIGSIMYYTKQWGGGDAKLLMAVGALFATRPYYLEQSIIPFLLIIFANILFFGAIYGLSWGIILAIKNRKKFINEIRRISKQEKIIKIKKYLLVICLVILAFVFLFKDKLITLAFVSMAAFLILYTYLWTFVKSVENVCMYKYASPKELTEGDWIAKDVISNKKIIYKKNTLGIEKKDIKRLIEHRIKKVLIKEGIPFAPPFLFGVLISLIFGKIILKIFI